MEISLYTRGNIFVYSWKYLFILVEIYLYTCGNIFVYSWKSCGEPSGALCARKNARLIANLSQISYLCIYYHCLALQKRPNWGIKHNKSQNSRANFSGELGEMALLCICWCSCAYTWCEVVCLCLCLCLHLEKKGTLEDSGGPRWWDTCKLFPGIISSLNKTALSSTTTSL